MVDIDDTVNTVVGGVVAIKVLETGVKLLDKKPKKSKKKTKGILKF
jgi:hypothetical protein